MNDLICKAKKCKYNGHSRCVLTQPFVNEYGICYSKKIETDDSDMKDICDDMGKE